MTLTNRFERLRTRIENNYFPDTCRIYAHTRTITDSGSYYEGYSDPLTYKGLPDIPCRIEDVRQYRVEVIDGQEISVNRYELYLPVDAPLGADHRVEVGGVYYESLRIVEQGAWLGAKQAILTEIDVT